MVFPKLLGKMEFLSPENIVFPFRRKMKDDIHKKEYFLNDWQR